ncbi:ABC transporter substrate-binding protein [Murimonas intestini]|uniref:Carbohydrate ABC transporter substrate-binding protein (CUT1 family) n=1 Tax=Murimonas intestini TaxID=1337051 RepID=A0AB73SXL4_9FIRM|nr:sugar ABC transporter substrate-binding protein [Murimonas intestini]MCR1843377.1 sugar ABC transporter substrate-binding protein [Murimonas intestini]MCR1868683.1 sugar ABC transporter substrate-binding protein [Murimonas intestini]MCR1886351.1 sugar ABC transporter substrate-binding protein [Murimonas intestini]
MKKKMLSVILSVVMVAGTFSSFTREVRAEDTVELQFLHTAWVPEQLEVLEKAISDFEAENPDIKIVETRSSWTDAPSQIMTSIVSGNAPDLIMCNTSMLAEYRGIGALADLSEYVSEETLDSFLPSAKAMITTEDGKIDGLPQEGCNWALFYRKDLFEEAGLDPEKPPKTWDEFLECAQALTKDTDGDGVIDQYGYAWPVQAENASDYWVNFMQMCGAEISAYENGEWISKLSDEAAVKGTQLMTDLVQKYKVSPASIVDYDWEAVTNAFVSGEVAMMQNGAWVTGSVEEKGPELEGKWGTAVLFDGPEQTAYRGYPNTFNILEASEHKEETWRFLDYFYNTPSDVEGLTIAGAFCNAAGGMLYTDDFVEYAGANYNDKLQPFLEEVNDCLIPPLDPQWQSLTSMYANSTVQQMIMGSVSVEEGMNTLDTKLKELHGE